MIPTRFKAKLAKELTWPLGAQAVSEALADAPHAAELTLAFHGWWAHDFRRFLKDPRPYPLLAVEYTPRRKPGVIGPNAMIERGWYEAKWELRVHPVFREWRAAAGAVLRATGLPLVAEWLRASQRVGWTDRDHRLELIFNPLDGTLAPKATDFA